MSTFAQAPNDGLVAFVSIAITTVAPAGPEDRLQVVQHEQSATLAQQVHQHDNSGTLAFRGRHLLPGNDPNGIAQPLSGKGRVAEAAPVQSLETGCELLGESGSERR